MCRLGGWLIGSVAVRRVAKGDATRACGAARGHGVPSAARDERASRHPSAAAARWAAASVPRSAPEPGPAELRRHGIIERLAGAALVVVLSGVVCPPSWALQRVLKSKVHNYPNTPVEVKRSKVTLVETFSAPTQFVAPGIKAKTTRVRYANRAGLAPSVFMLNGEVFCANTSAQPVEAISLAVILLDAFHQPVQVAGQRDAYMIKQVVEVLPRGGSKAIEWEHQVHSPEIYEIAVVVTRVRFADGSVWMAPGEELLDIF